MALTNITTFDLEAAPGGSAPVINASQGDIGRQFQANLYWNGETWTPGSGVTCKLRGHKPDNTVFEYTATVSGSSVTFATTEQMTIIDGAVDCELVFTQNSNVIASANFVLMVEDSPYNPDALSESDIPTIGDLIEQTIGGDIRDEVDALITANPELMLQDNAVTTPKLAAGAVTEGKIASNAVTTGKLATGAVTSAKVDADFLKTIENAYVTPEQFGAKGDGTTDDTAAIQAAINTGKKVVGKATTYKILSPLLFENFTNKEFDFSASTISSSTGSCAIKITDSENSTIRIHKIMSQTDNGVLLESLVSSTYVQYIQLYIDEINIKNTTKDCILANVAANGWVNEISIWNTRLFSSGGGIHIVDGTTAYSDGVNNWKFYNIGCEGYKPAGDHLKYGYYFENTGTAIMDNFLIVGGRYAESLDLFIKTRGEVEYLVMVAPYRAKKSLFDVDSGASHWIVTNGVETDKMFRGNWVQSIDFGLAGTDIESGTDLNTLPCGRFNVKDNSVVDTLQNAPTGAKFGNIAVEMLSNVGDITHKWAFIKQTYSDYTNKTWTRVLTTNGATPPVITAGAWKELQTV